MLRAATVSIEKSASNIIKSLMISAVAYSFVSSQASAQSCTGCPTVTNTISVLTNNSANDADFATGAILYEQATVSGGTTSLYGFMRQGTTNASLFTLPEATNPNAIAASIPYTSPSTLTGPWTLHVSTSTTFTSSNTTLINTPAVGSVGIMPFVNSMTITAGSTPLNPTISWVLPSTAGTDSFGTPLPTISQVVVNVSDISNPIQRTNINPFSTMAVVPFGSSFSQADRIYSALPFSPSTTSFTIPTINDNPNQANFGSPVLQYGHTYSIGISLQNVRPGSTPVAGCPLCTVDSRSNSFFDYTPIDPTSLGLPAGTVIHLPSTTPVPTTSGEFFNGPVYSFHVGSVGPTQTTYIDPVAAYGFVYTIGAGDPFFASVTAVTHVGNGIYQLLVWNGSQYVLADSSLEAGEFFDFLAHGFSNVAKFEIIGIDPAAGLDPTNITAFVTGLTFTGDGAFTGTMQPLVLDTTAAVPGPVAGAGVPGLLFCGSLVLLVRRWRKRQQCVELSSD